MVEQLQKPSQLSESSSQALSKVSEEQRSAKLHISPEVGLIDVAREIRVTGLLPAQKVLIETATVRANNVTWRSAAVFEADADGNIDLGTEAPISGDYSGIDAMGLIWSQQPESSGSREVFPEDLLQSLVTKITVKNLADDEVSESVSSGFLSSESVTSKSTSSKAHSSEAILEGTLIQEIAVEGVRRIDVRENGLVGTVYLPATKGPHPAVMILNGSGGGMNEPRAALYASHGYIAFALAYFKAPGLSDYISNTPLEYFKKGLDWLRETYRPLNNFVAINGQSRGGELVLLLASLFPEDVSAVVAYVPGAVVHSGQNAADPKVGREGPAWLLDGKPLPHIWENNRTATWKPFDEGPSPHRHEKAILTALEDSDAVKRARIPVENIQAPIILLSATDDGAWPSSRYSKMVVDLLESIEFPYDVRWVDTKDGGHGIVFPFIPTTQIIYTHPVSGKVSTNGGKADANARSNERSWNEIKDFLQTAVAQNKA